MRIGTDTGASEFPGHAAAFRKFGQIQSFVFVLDGDARNADIADRIRDAARRTDLPVLFIPGRYAPEVWVWQGLTRNLADCASALGIDQTQLQERINRANAVYDSASDTPSEIAKSKLRTLADFVHRDSPDICRIVARLEATQKDSDIQPLVEGLKTALLDWRGR